MFIVEHICYGVKCTTVHDFFFSEFADFLHFLILRYEANACSGSAIDSIFILSEILD